MATPRKAAAAAATSTATSTPRASSGRTTPPKPTPITSLGDDLRTRRDEELVALLLARPDLARPAPADLTALAARATTRSSVSRAVEDLDLGGLRLAQAAVVAAARRPDESLDVARLAALADLTVSQAVAGLTDLWERALVWRDGDGWRLVGMLAEVLGPHPAGLGLAADEVPERYAAHAPPLGSALDDLLETAPPEARAVLDALAWGPPTAAVPPSGPGKDGATWLVDQGLAMPSGLGHIALVREVALQLRGGVIHRDSPLVAPVAAGQPIDPTTVDRVAGVHSRQFLDWLDDLAQEWGRAPARVLRSGGVGVRDLTLLARALDVPADTATFVVEAAFAADLVANDGELVPTWVPTTEYETWSGTSPADRWATVCRAWRDTPRAAYLVGATIGRTQTVGALTPEVIYPPVRQLRLDVLRALASQPAGQPVTADELTALVRWRRPLRDPRQLDRAVQATLREAELLGVVGLGSLTSAGRALAAAASDADLAAHALRAMPAPVDRVLLQGDLTVVAPGPLVGPLDRFVRLACDIESRGSATVFRITATSVRRALDTGMTADELLARFAEASSTPVPQPLDYLVRDVSRRHGQARVGGATAYLRCDDEAVLVAILADRGLAPAMLRRIAPTVLVSRAEPSTLLDLLREHGYAPAQEAYDGTLVVSAPVARRTRARRRAGDVEPTPPAVDEAVVAAVVAHLRAAPARPAPLWAGSRSGPTLSTSPTDTAKLLREALADSRTLWLGYADANGRTARHLVRPVRLEGGRLYAVSGDSAAEQLFVVHRITGVALA